MNIYFAAVVFIFVAEYVLETAAEVLNLKHLSFSLPQELKDIYKAIL